MLDGVRGTVRVRVRVCAKWWVQDSVGEMAWGERGWAQDSAGEMVWGGRGCMQGGFEMVGVRWHEGDSMGETAWGE